MSMIIPTIGEWYEDLETGQVFEVVARDQTEGTIEIQYQSGEINEYDMENWLLLPLAPVDPSETWQTPHHLIPDSHQDLDQPIIPENWSGVLSQIEPDQILGLDDF